MRNCGNPVENARAWVAWLREATVEEYQWSAKELGDFDIQLVKAVRNATPDDLHPNVVTCRYCPRQYSCPARLTEGRGAIQFITGQVGELTDPAAVIRAKKMLPMIRKACDLFDDRLKEQLAAGASIVSDDEQLILATSSKETIGDANAGWRTMTEHLGEDRLIPLVTLAKGAVVEAAKQRVRDYHEDRKESIPRGKLTAIEKDLLAALRAAGAMTRSDTKTLKVVKVKP
jgi:hypothetical protein